MMVVSVSKPKNVVLVHGAFADGSSWSGVVEYLQDAGLRVVAVQNPLTSLAADVDATQRVLESLIGETVLVGHSYGGTVISKVGVDSNVTGLVYVAALAPEAGQNSRDLEDKYLTKARELGEKYLSKEPELDDVGSGFRQLKEKEFLKRFAPDVPHAKAKVLAASQGPMRQIFLISVSSQTSRCVGAKALLVRRFD